MLLHWLLLVPFLTSCNNLHPEPSVHRGRTRSPLVVALTLAANGARPEAAVAVGIQVTTHTHYRPEAAVAVGIQVTTHTLAGSGRDPGHHTL